MGRFYGDFFVAKCTTSRNIYSLQGEEKLSLRHSCAGLAYRRRNMTDKITRVKPFLDYCSEWVAFVFHEESKSPTNLVYALVYRGGSCSASIVDYCMLYKMRKTNKRRHRTRPVLDVYHVPIFRSTFPFQKLQVRGSSNFFEKH